MRVEIPGGDVVDLGTTETAPTIGLTDYSRRATDDFGVTTVVERGFSRKMSVRMALPFDDVDALQRRLADLRATAALWVADDRYDSLKVNGFYKDFSLDVAMPPISYCTLTIEGLTETAAFVDSGGDPAPVGLVSTLQLLQPVILTDAMLTASNVPENDYSEWSSDAAYPLGGRVIKTSTHRIYESVLAANIGHDPAALSGQWIDIGATNRWTMFDQALGSVTASDGNIVVTLQPGAGANAVALLDVTGALVRVQAAGYDRAKAPSASPGMALFLDVPDTAGPITVTIAGGVGVSVGTLLVGRLVGLGVTEASPTAAITDFSRKDVDDFGEATIVERAWAKRMTAAASLRSDALDLVAGRIAAVRARPSLWIGDDGSEAITIYGFFKDFSIEVGETVSKLSLSIEGLSKAASILPLAPPGLITVYRNAEIAPGKPPFNSGEVPAGWSISPVALAAGQYRWSIQAMFLAGTQKEHWSDPVKVGGIGWTDVINNDPARPKPQDGADVTSENTAKDVRELAGRLVEQVLSQIDIDTMGLLQQALRQDDFEQISQARMFVDGQPVSGVFKQFRNEQIGVNSAVESFFTLMGVKNEDGTVFIIDGASVQIYPGKTIGSYVTEVGTKIAGVEATAALLLEVLTGPDGNESRAVLKTDLNGNLAAVVLSSGEEISGIGLIAGSTTIADQDGTLLAAFGVEDGLVYISNLLVDTFRLRSVDTDSLALFAGFKPSFTALISDVTLTNLTMVNILSLTITKRRGDSVIDILGNVRVESSDDIRGTFYLYEDGVQIDAQGVFMNGARGTFRISQTVSFLRGGSAAGSHTYDLKFMRNGGASVVLAKSGTNFKISEIN